MLALEGKQLGNYDVIRRIRVGGMGAVYEGRQRSAFGRRVAIKVILGDYAKDRDMRRRFAREARTVAQLQHPHILPLIEFGDEQGILYLVMPFIEGGTLTSYLRRALPDLQEVANIYLQLLEAVEYAHEQGLIHRDIKSSNVLLEQRRNAPPYIYLADFGLVRTSQRGDSEQKGAPIPLDQVPGTPHYMAPEQTRGIITTSTDIYALGVLLYQMLTGELPYDDPDEVKVIQMHLSAPIPSPSDQDASIPVEVSEVIRIAMAKRPEDRYRTVAELRNAFEAAINGPVEPVEDDFLLDTKKPSMRRPMTTPIVPPEPIPLETTRRVQRGPTPVPLATARQRATASIPGRNGFDRTIKKPRRRFTLPLVLAILIPIALIIILIVPRLLGINIVPTGLPLLSANAIATVTVTPQSKTEQDNFVLIASPQIQTPDLTTREIPDRVIQSQAKDSRTVAATGSKTIAGVQATGTLVFTNSTTTPVSVPASTPFTTTSGIQLQLTQSVIVQAQQAGQNGTASASAIAVNAGISGNIAIHALNTTCCNGLTVTNPAAFTGGVDAHSVHIVQQSDLDGVRQALNTGLQQQVTQQLQKQTTASEMLAEDPIYNTVVTSDIPVGGQTDQVQVQVAVSSTVAVYDRDIARHTASQLLNQEALQSLGASYQLQGAPVTDTPRVVQLGDNGIVYLSVAVHGFWVYNVTAQQISQWSQSIKGSTPALATAYLKAQTGIASAQIDLPFGVDHLPTSVEQIKIVLASP